MRMIFADVDLGHIGAGSLARVAHIEADFESARPGSRMNLQPRVLKAGVRKPEAKRE